MSRAPARRIVGVAVAALVLAGCALRSDVRRVETEVAVMREDQMRQDSIRSRQLNEIIRLQQRLIDSLAATRVAVSTLRGDVANDLYGVQQQLVQLQELTGQSQRRLGELRTQLERRGEQLTQPGAGPAPAGGAPSGQPADAGAAAPSADQMYETSLGQLRRGSAGTARSGFRELLRAYPNAEQAPDAIYYIWQSFEGENADSALAYYDQVGRSYPQSPRAASALYHVGLLRERARDTAGAREAFQKVVQTYPASDEAALARDRLKALGR